MLVFARVALTGSFTTAAADLGMPKSTVSRKVTELEARLKARLLNRTTRKVSLTDVGGPTTTTAPASSARSKTPSVPSATCRRFPAASCG